MDSIYVEVIMKKKMPPSKTEDSSLLTLKQEVKKLLEKYNASRDELQRRLDEFREISGLSQKEVRAYFEDPDNFSPKQWEEFQKEKKKYLEMIAGLEKNLSESTRQKIAAAKASPALKKARSRLRGIKQKWIPM